VLNNPKSATAIIEPILTPHDATATIAHERVVSGLTNSRFKSGFTRARMRAI
jgi:hypothetical protein